MDVKLDDSHDNGSSSSLDRNKWLKRVQDWSLQKQRDRDPFKKDKHVENQFEGFRGDIKWYIWVNEQNKILKKRQTELRQEKI